MTDVGVKFSREDLIDMLNSDEPEGYKIISDEICDRSRWSIYYDLVFEYKGRFFNTYYSVGATESQDEGPFEHDSDMIKCVEVTPVEKTVIVYVPLNE